MKISFGELLNRGDWDEVCEKLGLNVWCIAEGVVDKEDEIELSAKQAFELGLVEIKHEFQEE